MSCHICELNARAAELPFVERLYLDDDWRLSHGWSSLPGWLVLAPRHHLASLGDLSATAAATLGPLLRASTNALKEVVGCERAYVMLFAEHPSYRHLHLHVVPRMTWFTEKDRGPAVFRYLTVPEEQRVPADERERLARAIAARIEAEVGRG